MGRADFGKVATEFIRPASIVAGVAKLVRHPARQRLVVLATDAAGRDYLDRSDRELLPLTVQARTSITVDDVSLLPTTAASRAEADGPWMPLTAELIWQHEVASWYLLAWKTAPEREGTTS